MGDKFDYKMWLIEQIIQLSDSTIVEANNRASAWMDSSNFDESYSRWRGLKRDVIAISNT